jgi:hypothetical protein
MMGVFAVFSRRARGWRVMHAVRVGESATVCGLPTGVGSGLVRDGDYHNNKPCVRCWK